MHNPIDTVAGRGRTAPFGDGGPALAATLTRPALVAADSHGNVYFSEPANHRVRRIDLESGTISTVAGTGELGFSGDGGPAISALLHTPGGLAVDSLGNLYIVDNRNHRVRRVSATTGIISTVAGTGEPRFSGDDGLATSAGIGYPVGLAVDSLGHLYIGANNRVRRVDAASGIISTVAGNGERGFSGDGGPATSASMINGLEHSSWTASATSIFPPITGCAGLTPLPAPSAPSLGMANEASRAMAVRPPPPRYSDQSMWPWMASATSILPIVTTTACASSTPPASSGRSPGAAPPLDSLGTEARPPSPN